jgi:O-antigen/teichoic acid export membrane protein
MKNIVDKKTKTSLYILGTSISLLAVFAVIIREISHNKENEILYSAIYILIMALLIAIFLSILFSTYFIIRNALKKNENKKNV